MTGAPDLDAMTAEEFVAYLDDLDRAEKPRTPEQIWRAAYREEQRQKRVVGYQPDLFGGDPVTHFRRHRPAPDFPRPAAVVRATNSIRRPSRIWMRSEPGES